MAQIAVSITKRTAFRDAVQEFSNVYNYWYVGFNPGEGLAQSFIDNIVEIERLLHSTAVTFVKARVWSSGGTKAQNQMILQSQLTGTGVRAQNDLVDRERAFLVQWPAGLDVRGKPVRLKKWFHPCGDGPGFGIDAPLLSNRSGMSDGQREAITNIANRLAPLTIGSGQYSLVSETGRFTEGKAIAHRYFEHHQLGDQWRV